MAKWESREAQEDLYHYSPAVHPEDILYAGSDTEETPEEVAGKRSRYEYHAERIAAGKLPVLLSATLRGPLSKESGWTNPWRHVPQPKRTSSWWDPGSENMLFTRENVLQRAASHGLGYMKPSEALAWCKATAEAEALQMGEQDIQGEVLISVETDERDNEEDLYNQPPEDDDSMLPIEPAGFHGQTEKAKTKQASDPLEPAIGCNDMPAAVKRPADSRWLKGLHISKRAKWDGPTMSSPTPLPTTLAEGSHKRVEELDPFDVEVDSPAHRPSIKERSVHNPQRLPRLRSSVLQNEFYGRVSPNVDKDSFVTEVAPSSRDLEKFEYKKRRKKSHTESDRARSIMSKADDEEMLFNEGSARPLQQDEAPDYDELMEEDVQRADGTPSPPVLPQETSLNRTCSNTEIHLVEPDVNTSESEANDTSWAILKRNSQTLLRLEASVIGPSASSPIVPALQLSLADASPFYLTFSNHQSPETYGRHDSSKQRHVSLSPQEPQQIPEEQINKSFHKEGMDDDESDTSYEILNEQNELEHVSEEVLSAEKSSFEMSVVVTHQAERPVRVMLQTSQDPMDISTQSVNTTPTMSRRNPLPFSARMREVLHSESLSEGAQDQIMDETHKALSRNFQSLNSQESSDEQLFQSSDNTGHLDEQPDHAVATSIEHRTHSISCSSTTAPQAEEDEPDYETMEGIPEAVNVELCLQLTSSHPSCHSSPPSRQSPFIDVYAQSPFAAEAEPGTLGIEPKPSPVFSLPKSSFIPEPQREIAHEESNASDVLPGAQSPFAIAEILHQNSHHTEAGTPLCTALDPFIAGIQHEANLLDSRPSSPSLEPQSPWAEETHIPLPNSLLCKLSPGGEPSQQASWSKNIKSSPHPLPKLDWDPRARPETPEYRGIRPFSDFMSPTPSPAHNTTLFDDGLLNTQVLVEATTKNPWRSNLKNPHSRGSVKRVSFGILSEEATHLQNPISQTRISSPPLQTSKPADADYDDDDSPSPKKISKFYSATKKIPDLVSKDDNPTFSSPAFGAQAEAFIAADHELSIQKNSRMTSDHSPTRHLKQRTSAMDNVPRTRDIFDEYGFDRILRNRAGDRSPDLAIFDMDDALGEAGDFLEDWSVDAELKKARSSENGRSEEREEKGNENGSPVRRNRLFGFL